MEDFTKVTAIRDKLVEGEGRTELRMISLLSGQ